MNLKKYGADVFYRHVLQLITEKSVLFHAFPLTFFFLWDFGFNSAGAAALAGLFIQAPKGPAEPKILPKDILDAFLDEERRFFGG